MNVGLLIGPLSVKSEDPGSAQPILLEKKLGHFPARFFAAPASAYRSTVTVSGFSKIQIGFAFWYRRLTRVVPEKGPLNGCMYVCSSNIEYKRRCVWAQYGHLCHACIRGGPKSGPQTHVHNSVKSEPILKSFSLKDSLVNL